MEEQGDDECTPLMVASAAGRSQAVNLLLEHGALVKYTLRAILILSKKNLNLWEVVILHR